MVMIGPAATELRVSVPVSPYWSVAVITKLLPGDATVNKPVESKVPAELGLTDHETEGLIVTRGGFLTREVIWTAPPVPPPAGLWLRVIMWRGSVFWAAPGVGFRGVGVRVRGPRGVSPAGNPVAARLGGHPPPPPLT